VEHAEPTVWQPPDEESGEIHMGVKFLYRASETRAALGCGVTKFYQLINDGALDARRFGKRTYITATSLEEFVESLERVVTPEKAGPGKWVSRKARLKLEDEPGTEAGGG
jgi:hypothetical protein